MISKLFYIGSCLLIVTTYSFAQETGENYFPPPEPEGGWRKLEDPEEIRRLAGMDPARLDSLKQWLLDSDDRPFAAVVIRNGYIVLEVEREPGDSTSTGDVKSCAKAICAGHVRLCFPKEREIDRASNELDWGRPAHSVEEGLLRGKVGLMTWTGDMGMASFDDVSIEGPGILGTAVHTFGKLTVTWAYIKLQSET